MAKLDYKLCKVFYFEDKAKMLHVDFDGFGIAIECDSKPTEDQITVEYTGKIGTANFDVNIYQGEK